MDTALSFSPHIAWLTNTALKTLGFILRNTGDFVNVACIKLLFYTLVRSRIEYCCVVWTPYHQNYINMLENVLRKYAKYLHLKLFNRYPVRHCELRELLTDVGETTLVSRRKTLCLVFLQKLLRGEFSCSELLETIGFTVPRAVSRRVLTFYYSIPNTFNHLHSPLIGCLRLYNSLARDIDMDIFFDDFTTRSAKRKLTDIFFEM